MTDPVTRALEMYRAGEVPWTDVLDEVSRFRFLQRPFNSHGEYVTVPGSFEDTVTRALQRRWITRAEWRQLRDIWKAQPSRVRDTSPPG